MLKEIRMGRNGVEIRAEFEDGELIGHTYANKKRGTVTIGRIYVNSDYRGDGWSGLLLSRAVNWARQKGSREVFSTLIADPGSETSLVSLFENNGFKIRGNQAIKKL